MDKYEDQLKVRTRFAPSPTGYMHIGGMRTALYAYMFAKKYDGIFILRIEDTDMERKVSGAEEIIYNTLEEVGLIVDEGPLQGGNYGPYIQSQRKDSYMKYALELVDKGGAYYCFCTKERLDKIHKEGHTKYDKHCLGLDKNIIELNLKNNIPFVIRQNIPSTGVSSYEDMVFGTVTVPNIDMEDNVLIKSDGMPTYNFANVVDDHLMAITHIIRGTEYLSSTPKYNMLYKELGWDTPKYMHLQPVMRDATHKLSKRYGDKSYYDYIQKGYLKEAIINYIALLGWSPKEEREKFSLQEMIEKFEVSGLSKSSSIFDENKMRWLNSQYIKELSEKEFFDRSKTWIDKCNLDSSIDKFYLSTLLKNRCETLEDVIKLTGFLEDSVYCEFDIEQFVNNKLKTTIKLAKEMIADLLKIVSTSWNDLHNTFNKYATDSNYKVGQVLWIFRIAITGASITPGGALEMATLLGRKKCIQRLSSLKKRL